MSSTGAPPLDAHPTEPALEAYSRRQLRPAALAAIDVHLQSCLTCRASINERVASAEAERLQHNLLAIEAELDAPTVGVVERSIARIGISADTARLLAATPSLRRSWFIAIGAVLFFGLGAANPDRPDSTVAWFLALAPLIPVAGVALAYGPSVDPSYEMTLVSPISGFRLVLLRTVAVLTASITVTAAVALLMVGQHSVMVGAWLVPALMLSAVCLALMTRVPTRTAGAVVSGVWLVVVVAVGTRTADGLTIFRPAAQVVMAAIAVAAGVAVMLRRGSFDVASGDLA